MSARIAQHIRDNVYGLIAIFIALGGTAYAVEANSIKSKHIANGQVKTADLGALAVTSDKLADDAVGTDQVAANSLGAADINESDLDPTVLQRRLGAACSGGQVMSGVAQDGSVTCTGSGGAPSGPAGGDLAGTYPDPTISSNAVSAAEVVDGSLDDDDIANTGSLGTLEISETSLFNDNSLTDADIDQSTFSTAPSGAAGGDLSGSYPSPAIATGAITNGDINASAAIAYSKLAGLSPGQAVVGNASGVAAPVTISGDATLAAAGGLTIAASAIGSAEVSDDSLVSDDIDNNGLRQVDLGSVYPTASLNFANVPANSCGVQPALTPAGMTPGEIAIVLPADGAAPVGIMYETGISIANDTLELNICNVTNADINPPTEDYRIASFNP